MKPGRAARRAEQPDAWGVDGAQALVGVVLTGRCPWEFTARVLLARSCMRTQEVT
jgi:hypothetical protein